MKAYLGIDIGGSAFKYGWGNSVDGLMYFGSIPVKEKSLKEFKAITEAVLQETSHRFGMENIVGIGIGTPGTIDRKAGKIVGVNPNLPFWVNHNPLELIPASVKIPVMYDNDANLMALAEATYQKKSIALGITVGSGIGCGIVIDGRIYHGTNGFAGELGHVIVVDNGAQCNCGMLGCMEAYASVDGIGNRLAEESPHYEGMTLTQLLSIKKVDELVAGHINRGLKMFCQSISNAIVWLDPEAVILGGGAMDVGLYSLLEIKKEIEHQLPAANRYKTEILQAVHGNKAGVIGAIKLIEQSFMQVSE